MSKRGEAGGKAVVNKYGKEYMRELARKGGKSTVERYGFEHMSEIGRAGYRATVERHWKGDTEAFKRWLTKMGQFVQDPAPWNGAVKHPGPWGGDDGRA